MKINTDKVLNDLSKLTSKKQVAEFIITNYAGPANRFERQAIAKALTGDNIPLVKCGISHLTEYADAWMAKGAKPKATKTAQPKTEPATSIEPKPGLEVIRKCGTRGIVTAIADGKVLVKLDNGSERKPNIERFKSLYKAA